MGRIGVGSVQYEMMVGDDMTFPNPAPGFGAARTPINDQYERLTFYRYFNAAGDIEFGRMDVMYSP